MWENLQKFWSAIQDEFGFLLVALGFIAVLFVAAVAAEKVAQSREIGNEKTSRTKRIAVIGVFSALAAVLMYIEFPLPFIAPGFYELDFSEIPIMIVGFVFGPVAGVTSELVKILIKLIIKPTSTAFVGELANFIIGCSFVVPASIIYRLKKTKKSAIIGLAVGTASMALIGMFVNAFVLVPAFAKLFGGMPVSEIVAMGTAVNPAITDIFSFVALAVAPFNILKGIIVSIPTIIIYKFISKTVKSML